MKSSGVIFTCTLFLLTLLSTKSLADEYNFRYGISTPRSPSQSKVFGLGYYDHLVYGFHYTLQADLINTPANTKSNTSFIAGPGLGLSVEGEKAFARVTWGPSYLSQKDQDLGGHFQFMQDLVIGVQDYYNIIGVGYKHISSAGIEKPNHGKDFLYIIIGVKF